MKHMQILKNIGIPLPNMSLTSRENLSNPKKIEKRIILFFYCVKFLVKIKSPKY